MKAKSAREISEEEVDCFLEKTFGINDIEHNPKVGNGKADFRVKSIDTYVEVHAIKNIAKDQIKIVAQRKNIAQIELKEEGQNKILDRIAGKLLHECTQLPDGKKNLIVTKTEGYFIDPDDVIDTIVGQPHVLINPENMQTTIENREDYFRTQEELDQVLQKISAIIAYSNICEHGKLRGKIGNNRENAKVPFDNGTFKIFHQMLCNKC